MRRNAIVMLAAGLCTVAATAPNALITASHRTLRSIHDIPVELRAPRSFRLLAPSSRRAEFDGHPYDVTIAALVGKSEAVMFHAEKVADGSGASNYDKLPPSRWPGFRMRGQCAGISAEDVREEHDLHWLAARGWNPAGNLAIEQHFKTTPDHNQEVVISVIAKIRSCEDKAAVDLVISRLRSKVLVKPIQERTATR